MIINNLKSHHFFRWAGGKQWLVKHLEKLLPADGFNNYHEPFLGGASIFFAINPKKKSYLTDLNAELINAYINLRDDLENVWSIIIKFKNSKDHYNTIRNSYNKGNGLEKAAMFIYLNRTSFNGIYRVNLKGEYNVPYGFKNYKKLFDYDKMFNLSNRLKNSFLYNCDFESTLENIKKGDLVYLDPPYTVSTNKDSFIKYNEKLFDWQNQERLASYIKRLIRKNAKFILSNAYHEDVLDLFGSFGNIHDFNRSSTVGGKKAKRGTFKEVIIKNF
jgi:DNA adenine methylase